AGQHSLTPATQPTTRSSQVTLVWRPLTEDSVDHVIEPILVKAVIASAHAGAIGFFEVAAPVRTSAICIAKGMFIGKGPGAEDTPGFLHNAGIDRETGNGAPGIQRRLRFCIVRHLLYRIASICFRD